MRLVTWNAYRGPIAHRLSRLSQLQPDLVVLQECSSPSLLDEAIRAGPSVRQGVAIAAANPAYRLTRVDDATYDDAGRCDCFQYALFAGALACGPAPRDSGAPTPTARAESVAITTRSADTSRPSALGLAVAALDRMATGARPRAAGDRRRMAPPRLPPVLDLEEPTPHRVDRPYRPTSAPDSHDVRRESALGCASDPWRAAEAGHRRESVDRREVHGPAPTPTVADVANVPGQPRRARSWPPTSSWCRPSRTACCSCW